MCCVRSAGGRVLGQVLWRFPGLRPGLGKAAASTGASASGADGTARAGLQKFTERLMVGRP